jgi:hypothetical protein
LLYTRAHCCFSESVWVNVWDWREAQVQKKSLESDLQGVFRATNAFSLNYTTHLPYASEFEPGEMRKWRHRGMDGIEFLFDTVSEELKIETRYDHDTYVDSALSPGVPAGHHANSAITGKPCTATIWM